MCLGCLVQRLQGERAGRLNPLPSANLTPRNEKQSELASERLYQPLSHAVPSSAFGSSPIRRPAGKIRHVHCKGEMQSNEDCPPPLPPPAKERFPV